MSALLTESGDTLVTERGNTLAIDSFEVCDWPTLAETKAIIGIGSSTTDSFLQRQINVTVLEIENYLGRNIPMAVQTDTIRPIESDKSYGYASFVQLKRWPIIEVIEIEGDDVLVDVDTIIQYEGILSGEFNAYEKVEIKYHGGLCPIPVDLTEVFYDMVQARYEARSDSSVNQELRKRTIPNVITEEFFAPGMADPCSVTSYANRLAKYKAIYV